MEGTASQASAILQGKGGNSLAGPQFYSQKMALILSSGLVVPLLNFTFFP